jgi:multidrug efflux pump subunit AcrA (membrane-fusion protein)
MRRTLLVLSPLLLAVGAVGCHRASSAAVARPAEDKTPSVAVVRPERKTLTRTIELSGQVDGIEHTAVYAKIAGYVEKLNVDIDDRVKKGDIVAELSIPETLDELKQKEALVFQAATEVTQAQKLLKVADATVARADANLKVAEATRQKAAADYIRWKAEYDRSKQLFAKEAVSAQEFEQITNQLRTAEAAELQTEAGILAAKAAVVEAGAQRDKADADVEVAKSRREVAQRDLDRQRTLVEYAHVRAPFNGIVTKRNIDAGHLLQPTGAQAMNGIALFSIARTDIVRVFVDVPEGDAFLVKKDTKATVVVPANQEREFEGKVVRTSWALDANSHTLRTEIQVPNPNGELRPGNYVLGRIAATASDAWTAPTSAVFVKDDQAYVVQIENDKTMLTPVKTGRRQGNVVLLVKKQIAPPGSDGRVRWEDFDGTELFVAETPIAYADGQAIRAAGIGDPSAK